METDYPSDDRGPFEEGPGMMPEKMSEAHPRRITHERRRELIGFAAHLAEQVEGRTRRHERCLLRRLVEALLDA